MKPYLLKNESVTINDIPYLIQTLKDRQQFSDPDQQAEALGISSATWCLFGVIWPASRVLANYVCALQLEGKRILEIGCGIGLSSIVLHQSGHDITASDYHPLARAFLDTNIAANNLSPILYRTGNWETENLLLGEYDLIIGSDILYEPAHPANVSRFIDIHSGQNTDVIIVDPGRGNRAAFTRHMIALGYTHHFEQFSVPAPDKHACKGRILHYQRST